MRGRKFEKVSRRGRRRRVRVLLLQRFPPPRARSGRGLASSARRRGGVRAPLGRSPLPLWRGLLSSLLSGFCPAWRRRRMLRCLRRAWRESGRGLGTRARSGDGGRAFFRRAPPWLLGGQIPSLLSLFPLVRWRRRMLRPLHARRGRCRGVARTRGRQRGRRRASVRRARASTCQARDSSLPSIFLAAGGPLQLRRCPPAALGPLTEPWRRRVRHGRSRPRAHKRVTRPCPCQRELTM